MPIEPELGDTCAWLRTLGDVAVELQKFAATTDDQPAAECARKALDRIDYLKSVERELPQMHETIIMLVRREKVPDENADALRRFQESLVDVGRAMIRLRLIDLGAFATTSLPPYDQWLPFKDGVGVH